MNFATLQGLTIPEGNVTQITDAYGNVLWKLAVDEGDEYVYLRPSADISVDDTLTLHPADATSAYMLINEEVSDGSATYIEAIASADNSTVYGTARFALSGTMPKNRTVTDIYVGVCAKADANDDYNITKSRIYITLYINGESASVGPPGTTGIWTGWEGTTFAEQLKLGFAGFASDSLIGTQTVLKFINEYVAANGVLPDMEVRIELYGYAYANGSKTSYGSAGISHFYVALKCE